ncbi:MAG TPA: NAD-dependent epimerase/dehydratase family protein [Polyangia bacterium]|jgi:dihydroflavonol-4-reductase
MKVCVTGGNGFIGSRVVPLLLADGHTVRCVLRPTSDTSRLEGLTYERAAGDVRDAASLQAAVAGCDAIIHLASPSSWNDINSPLLEAVVMDGTRNVLAAAQAAQARVVFCSTAVAINASSDPTVVFDETAAFTVRDRRLRYANNKHAAEQLCRDAAAAGLHVVIVNPGEVYGPKDTGFITAGNLVDFAKSSPVLVSKGGTAIAHVDDVALGIVRALTRGRAGERYILGGQNLSVRELASTTLRLLGIQRAIVTMPTGLLRAITRAATALHIPLPYNPLVIPYATRYWFMSSAKASRELGVTFRPADEVLAPTLAWLKETGHITPPRRASA